jgi:hypothetical protein
MPETPLFIRCFRQMYFERADALLAISDLEPAATVAEARAKMSAE